MEDEESMESEHEASGAEKRVVIAYFNKTDCQCAPEEKIGVGGMVQLPTFGGAWVPLHHQSLWYDALSSGWLVVTRTLLRA